MPRPLVALLSVVAVSILGFLAHAYWPTTHAATAPEAIHRGSLLIENATLVDPRTGSKTAGQWIAIRKGRIEDIGPASMHQRYPAYRRVNAEGQFAVPGFNNMHSHALQSENAPGVLTLMLAEGVTGFRQMAGTPELLAQRAAGQLPLTEKAPALLAMPAEPLVPTSAGTVDELADVLRQQRDEGADFIKVGWVTPPMFYAAIAQARALGIPIAGHVPEGVDPSRAELAGFRSIEHLGPGDVIWIACSTEKPALLSESIEHPTRSMPSFKLPNFAAPIVQAAIAGKMKRYLINPIVADSPARVARLHEAMTSFDRAKCDTLAEQFARNETWMVPTLVRLRTQYMQDDPAYREDPAIPFIPPASYQLWLEVLGDFNRLPGQTKQIYKDAYAKQKTLTKLLADAGVPMMTGTDGSGQAPGLSLQQEFKELAAAGLSPLQVLQMTTTLPARFMKRTDSMGLIAKDMNADLVLLAADPTSSVDNLGRISGVVRAGNYYSRDELEAFKKAIADNPERTLPVTTSDVHAAKGE